MHTCVSDTRIPCHFIWDIDIHKYFKDVNNPLHDELREFFKLPAFVEIKTETLILDACGVHLKNDLRVTHNVGIKNVAYDAKKLVANITWDFNLDYVKTLLDKFTASNSELLEHLELPSQLNLPLKFLDEALLYKTYSNEFKEKVKLHFENSLKNTLKDIHIEQTPQEREYSDATISLTYCSITHIAVEDVERELDISWEDVIEYRILGNTLFIQLKDHIEELTYAFHINRYVDSDSPYEIEVY